MSEIWGTLWYTSPQAYDQLVPRSGPPSSRRFSVSDNAYAIARTHLIATLTVQIIATLFLCARLYTRAFPKWRFTIDDYVICVAFALMTVVFGLWYRIVIWAWDGHRISSRGIDDIITSSKFGSIAAPIWAWATGLVKISIGLMLLRFQQEKRWRIVIYIMILLNVLLILLFGVVNLFQCIPYAALWDLRNQIKNKKCWRTELNWIMLYSSSVCNIVTDIVFSLMPLTFLRKIRRPLREKLVVGGLMALGLVASSFSLCKAIVNAKLAKSKDASASLLLLALISCLEVQTSLIAACAPTLHSLGKRFLQRLGWMQESRDDSPPPYAGESSTLREAKRPNSGEVELNLPHFSGPSSPHPKWFADDIGDEDEDAHYEQDPTTGRIVCTTELRVHSSRSALNDDWKAQGGWAMEDEWRAQKGIGAALY